MGERHLTRRIDAALAAALGTEDPRQVAKVTATHENLAKRLVRQ